MKIAVPREVDLIARLRDVFLAQAVRLIDASLKFRLNRQCDFERKRGHRRH